MSIRIPRASSGYPVAADRDTAVMTVGRRRLPA